MKITMPVAKGIIEGLLKNGEVTNLILEVNEKPVFICESTE